MFVKQQGSGSRRWTVIGGEAGSGFHAHCSCLHRRRAK